MKAFIAVAVLSCATVALADEKDVGERDGQVRAGEDGQFVAWDTGLMQWVGPESFWISFANRNRGRNWPSGREYPPYDEVKEHDTFLVQLESGPCLMYFFHSRWRRANDVRRWGEAFNDYGGCPHVFD